MSNTIDLTAESPPRPPLTLPGSYANNAAAGPSVSSSRATAAPQPSPAAPNSGRHTRQTLLQRRRNAAPGGGIGLLADTNLDTASLPELFVAPGQHSSPQNNDDFEFVGMSEGARLASEAAQRDAENARVWRQSEYHLSFLKTIVAHLLTCFVLSLQTLSTNMRQEPRALADKPPARVLHHRPWVSAITSHLDRTPVLEA